jgi:hypothetical protein
VPASHARVTGEVGRHTPYFSGENSESVADAEKEVNQNVSWDPWETLDPEEPIENSTSWRIGSYPGADNVFEEGECETSQFRNYPMTGETYEYPTQMPIGEMQNVYEGPYGVCAPTYAGGNYTSGGSYAPIENQFSIEDLTQENSGSEYIPSGKPYIPQAVCKTPRSDGWTPGMYVEE